MPETIAPLSVTLVPDEQLLSTLREDEHSIDSARALVIDSPPMAELANGELRGVIARKKRLEELRAGFIAPAKQIVENANALFNPALTALGESEKVLRGALTTWTTEQQRIADQARREAEEAQRKARQAAEAAAAAARAKAEEEAAEARRKAAKAEAERQAAIAAGNAKEAARLAAEAAKQTEKAAAVVENADQKAMETMVAVQAAAPVVAAPQKVAGFGLRSNYVAELAPGIDEATAVKMLVAAVADGRTDLLALLSLNMKSANALAKALKGAMSAPGLVAVDRPISTSRAA